LITTLKEREIHNLKQAAKDRQKRRSRVRSIPDEADLELPRPAKSKDGKRGSSKLYKNDRRKSTTQN
jgi:hypothetical protein